MPVVDLSALSANLQENKRDYEEIFSLKVADGFGVARQDFTVLPIVDKVELVRDVVSNITQPGRTGALNNASGAVTHKKRIAQLKPAKVDLLLNEVQLRQLAVSFLGVREPADPRDIHSVAGRTYLMATIFKQIAKEVNRAHFKGVLGSGGAGAAAMTGGLNLFDGLNAKFTTGYATSGTGWVGDIPGGNKVTSPAATVTQANILAEYSKMVDIVYNTEDVQEYRDEEAALYVPLTDYAMLVRAWEAQLSNNAQVVQKMADGSFVLTLLPNTKIKPRTSLNGVDNRIWTPNGNFFFLTQDTEENIPKIKFQEVGRDLQILIDWEADIDYADGRLIVLHK